MSGGVTPPLPPRIFLEPHVSLQPRRPMRDLVPGGYLFTHLIFWTVVALVGVGTNAVAIILSIGIGLLVFETATQQK